MEEANSEITLEFINDRIDLLEEKFDLNEKSLFKKFGIWGGIIALIVTVFVGALDIHDKTVVRRLETERSDKEKISNNVEKLSTYNQELSTLWAKGKDGLFELDLRTKVVNLERVKILSEIDALSDRIESPLDSITLIAIGNGYTSIGDISNATKYFEKSLEEADSFIIEIEGRRLLSETLAISANINDQKKSLLLIKEAFEMSDQNNGFQAKGLKRGIYDSWIKIEAGIGSCNHSRVLINEYTSFLQENNVLNPNASEEEIGNFKKTYDTLAPCKL